MLALDLSQYMMVVAHNDNLSVAQALGLCNAYINRPTAYGLRQTCDKGTESDWDICGESLDALMQYLW